MKRIYLYIDNELADLGDDEQLVLMNFTIDDLSNPAIVKNSYSQQITLPGTPANVAIFGSINQSVAQMGDYSSFNPMQKKPFTLYDDQGGILESGYIRLEQVVRAKGAVSFKVTLYGGLGGLFYSLSYLPDGTKMTLANLEYRDEFGDPYDADSDFGFDVPQAWDTLAGSQTGTEYDILNLVPMYNGTPDDFDASSAIVKAGVFDNILGQYTQDSHQYRPQGGTAAPYIIKFENEHNEWELRDLRDYLQRPAIRVTALLQAISAISVSVSDFTLDIQSEVFDLVEDVYMTLPLLRADYRPRTASSCTFGDVLEDTMSPADFIIGFAKMYNLVFVSERNVITLMRRRQYYRNHSSEIQNLSDRIDRSKGITIKPVLATSKYFDMALQGVGSIARKHKELYDREYGSYRLDTSYDFNDEVKNLLADVPFRIAAFTQDRGANYVWEYFQQANNRVTKNFMPISLNETLTAKLYELEGSTVTDRAKDVTIPSVAGLAVPAPGYYDWQPKLHTASEDGKAEDGSYIFVRYVSMQDTPVPEYSDAQGVDITFARLRYYLTHWDASRVAMNGGKDCWDLRAESSIAKIPRFENESLLFSGAAGIFARMWRRYLTERYNKNTRMMTCRVNMQGLPGIEVLPQYQYFYENTRWVINAIRNMSLTTEDTVEVDLVRVNDFNNYIY